MAVPSQSPSRLPNGLSTDSPFGPLANFGKPHPFSYHSFEDDFNFLNPSLTATKTSTGTIAATPGDGGLLLFTTAATAPDLCSIQAPVASFARAAADAGKKMFFLARLQVSSAANAAFIAGLIQQTTTPFTVTDGIYFSKATGSAANLVLNSAAGSVITSLVIPTSSYSLTDNTNIDLGFYVDRNGTIYAFVGANLVNVVPGNVASGQVKGSLGSITPAITTAALTPTLSVQAGTASAKTMTADFMMAAKER